MAETPRSPLVERFASGQMPLPARLAAARGALPIAREDILEILFVLREDPSEEVRTASLETIRGTGDRDLSAALERPDPRTGMLDWYARLCTGRERVVEAILLNPATLDETVEYLGDKVSPALVDVILLNQMRIIRRPGILDAAERNPKIPVAARRRIQEIRDIYARELESRRAPQAPGAAVEAPPPAPEEAATPETAPIEEAPPAPEELPAEHPLPAGGEEAVADEFEGLPEDVDLGAEGDEALEEVLAEELESAPKGTERLFSMTVPEKLEVAMKGSAEERGILIRDASKLVREAVLKSPKLSESEVERWASMRSIDEEVLRGIAANRDWMKNYLIIHLLCRNPKAPTGITLRLVPRLTTKDLISLQRNRNVPGLLRTLAGRLVFERTMKRPAFKKGKH